ncbi:hypothetical protein CPLU01_05241 [Colletotrichum plurivorum]|uniref:Uncharacterized protein n=1 Tax=Colletotrichum plurivorum TaxID=2175906 RepID=A0A8H6KMS2_9PEZI|nr:hypothetical protein CPLU01_05241 [Colletotrichum plurivorum]
MEVCCQIQLRDTSELRSYGCVGRESGSGQTSRLFWQDIKRAIHSGRTTSSPASTTAHRILRVQMIGTCFESFDFVWEVFATLSSVNTAACPGLRRSLLSRLWVTAANRLHVSHPVAEICGLLYQCAEDFELASAALVKAWSVFGRRLGDVHPATCRLRRLIIRIARRGRRLQCAELMARELYGRVCSDGARSYLARSCARSLSHVLVDLGRLGDARHICLAIVGSASPEDAGPETCDSRTAQAMEDLARIELLASDVQASLWWLRRARAAAERLWPESMILRSIDEKLLSDPYVSFLLTSHHSFE